jgi:alpha-amylase/alpha-mannosidase (GH57 family)
MSAKKLNVVLLWHMHQPDYRDSQSDQYRLPWTYLHAIKDYTDMAAHIEDNPDAKAVFNFVPILLEQLDDYAQQIGDYFQFNRALRDPLLASLVSPIIPTEQDQRLTLVKSCLRINRSRLIDPFPHYLKLVAFAEWLLAHPDMLTYVEEQFFVDLIVWYHLAWMGETVKQRNETIKGLIEKGSGYSLHDRREVVKIIGELIGQIIPRYQTLHKRGQVELCTTPYAHPIVPLLLDLKSAREAMPDVSLPSVEQYSGGEQRARWHIEKGLETFEHYFGFRPRGCWPSEGSVSDATVSLLGEYDIEWVATGEAVLHNSLKQQDKDGQETGEFCLQRGYQYNETAVHCFFRDDGLSDAIGFTYADWHADDAVNNMIHHLENIAKACADVDEPLVSIVLDGENAWEYYPQNGLYFLSALYERLADHPQIHLTTYSEYIDSGTKSYAMDHLVAGSWVYGTFSTWIGDPDKNRAWDMLAEAKKHFDEIIDSDQIDESKRERLQRQLAICEGSDWFWWLGDYNPEGIVSDFERLFRINLVNLYQLMGVEPPEYLSHVFAHGTGAPSRGGVMRQGQQHP